MSRNRLSTILDADGRQMPVFEGDPPVNGHHRNGVSKGEAIYRAAGFTDAFQAALNLLGAPIESRAQDPFTTHPWVFAAARTIAAAVAQAPFSVFRETDSEFSRRERLARKRGAINWTPGRGRSRRAVSRWLHAAAVQKRVMMRGIERDDEHPLTLLFQRPNPYQTEVQFWERTITLLAYQGACMWVASGPLGEAVPPTSIPGALWPMPAELFTPVYESGQGGLVVAWDFQPPVEMPVHRAGGRTNVRLMAHEVISLLRPNPYSLIRGVASTAPAAGAIDLDLRAGAYNRALLKNDATPRGVLQTELQLEPEKYDELVRQWKEKHGGEQRAGLPAILHSGLRFMPTGMAPADLAYSDAKRFDREEILATHGSPPSLVGLTEFTNFATAQIQQAHFWGIAVLPITHMIEQVFDGTILFTEPDNVFAGFDLARVDALRAMITEKLVQAEKMANTVLHAPPRVAYDVVGIDVPKYQGDDVALVPALSVPLRDVLSGATQDVPVDGSPPDAAPDVPPDDGGGAPDAPSDGDKPQGDADRPDAPKEGEGKSLISLSRAHALARGVDVVLRAQAGRRWRQFVEVLLVGERKTKSAYRSWSEQMRTETLRRFDAEAKRASRSLQAVLRAGEIDIAAILPTEKEARGALKSRVRPIYANFLDKVYEFTLDDLGGVTTFSVDDERLLKFFDARESKFANTTTGTMLRSVRSTLTAGIAQGETIMQLRLRVAEAFNIAGSASRALTVARTESAGFANGVRNEMFIAAGVSKAQWTTAGDEAVRSDHRVLGDHGPEPLDFNYLALVGGGGGKLRFPCDPEGPAKQVINCRCFLAPTE